MKLSIKQLASVVALVLSIGFFGTANADAPSIIENGVEEINSYANCYMAPDNMSPVAASIDAGEWVTTLESDVPGWRFIAYGDGYCWVWSELVGSLPDQIDTSEITVTSSEVPATTVPAVTTVPTVTTFPSTGSGPIYSLDLGVDGVGTKPELTEAQEMSAWIIPAGIVVFIGIIVAIRWYDVRHEKHVNSL